MDTWLFECFDLLQSQGLNELTIVDQFIGSIRILCVISYDEYSAYTKDCIRTNFIQRTGWEDFKPFIDDFVGKSIGLVDQVICMERSYSSQCNSGVFVDFDTPDVAIG